MREGVGFVVIGQFAISPRYRDMATRNRKAAYKLRAFASLSYMDQVLLNHDGRGGRFQ